VAEKYRHSDGGNLLFRTVGLKAFAKATRTLMNRGLSADSAVKRLAGVPLELNHNLWTEVLWRRETKTMLTKFVRLAQNVFLYEAGSEPATKGLNVEREYARVTGKRYPS
jgi:hypothetical protein